MNFYVLFDSVFPCGIPPQHVVEDVSAWLFGAHQGYGEGQVEIGVCGRLFAPKALMVDVVVDIEGCPSTAQKQVIENDIRALFQRISPSMPLRLKQIELIVAAVIGTEISTAARFEIHDYSRDKVFVANCGDLEPECDWMPCVDKVSFVGPTSTRPIC